MLSWVVDLMLRLLCCVVWWFGFVGFLVLRVVVLGASACFGGLVVVGWILIWWRIAFECGVVVFVVICC